MKMINRKSTYALSAAALGVLLATGCGTELDQAGINTEQTTDIEPVLYNKSGYTRYSREVMNDETGQVELEYFFERSGVPADFPSSTKSAGIYGMGTGAKVPVEILSVKDITGTVYDPVIRKEIKTTQDDCDERNISVREANKAAEDGWLVQKEDAEANGRPAPEQPTPAPTETCEDIAYIYQLMSYTPVELADAEDVTNEGFFKYRLDKTYDGDSREMVGTTWPEIVDPENPPLTTENGELTLLTSIQPTFDLTDEQWQKAYQAKLKIGNRVEEYIVGTGARNPVVEPMTGFLSSKVNLKPGRTYTLDPFKLRGANTNVPVKITKSGDFKDFDVYYSTQGDVADKFLPYEEGVTAFTTRAGQDLFLQIRTKDAANDEEIDLYYDQTLSITVSAGEALEGDDGKMQIEESTFVHTQPVDYLPAAEVSWQYPLPTTATYSETVKLRGKAYISLDMLEFSDNGKVPDATIPEEYSVTGFKFYRRTDLNDLENPGTFLGEIEPSYVTPLPEESVVMTVIDSATGEEKQVKRNAYTWQLEVPLEIGENHFVVTSTANLTRTWPDGSTKYGYSAGDVQVAQSEWATASITRLEEDDELAYFPDFMTNAVLEEIVDVSLDPRNGTLLLIDRSGNNDDIEGNKAPGILWGYDLVGNGKPTCKVLPWTWQDHGVNGVQFNHALPEMGGVVISGSTGNVSYFNDQQIDGTNILQATKPEAAFNTEWNGVKHPGHMAYDVTGKWLFMSAKSDWSNDPRFQGIVGIQDPEIENFVFKNWGEPGVGIVAKETNSTEDAAKLNNNAVSLDIYSKANRDNPEEVTYEEYVLVLDGKDNTVTANNGQTNLRKMKVSASYNPETSHSKVTLVDSNQNQIRLYKADAVAVSNTRGKAYVVDNKDKLIYEIDLSNIAESDSLTAKVIASPFHDNQPKLGTVKSLVVEGDMDYMVISDVKHESEKSALLVMDLETYDMAYLLKTNNLTVDETKTHCAH